MINLSEQRFTVIGADTMLSLIGLMNNAAHPLARVIYFGVNYGDYSNVETYGDNARSALFIAVFDYAPAMVYPVDEFQIQPVLDDSDTSNDVSPNSKVVMSA